MSKDDRLSGRIDSTLKRWLRAYAKRNNTTVIKIITDHILALKKQDERRGQDALEQL